MIVDRLENAAQYPFGAAWDKAFTFLRGLAPDVAKGRIPIQGEEIFALVSGYASRPPSEALFEAHRSYVDIQVVLLGREGCEWSPEETLVPEIPFDPTKDVAFYRRPSQGPGRVELVPGTFVVFFSQDAHMPGLIAGDRPEQIKKVVVKIKRELLDP